MRDVICFSVTFADYTGRRPEEWTHSTFTGQTVDIVQSELEIRSSPRPGDAYGYRCLGNIPRN